MATADLSPQGQTESVEINPLASPVAVFQGYDSVSGQGLSTAVEGTKQTNNGASSVKYEVCFDVEQICQVLQVGGSVSAGYGPFQGSRKTQFVHSLTTTTYSLSIVVYSLHSDKVETYTDVRLKSGVAPPTADNTSLNQFFQGYGDSFLSSVTTGGEYYGVYTLYAQTKEEQTQLVNEMKAQGIFEGVTIGGALQTSLNNFVNSVKVRISFDQEISGISNPSLPDPSNLISFALAFPSIPLSAPAIINFDSTGYERVPGITTVFNPIADNRRYFVGDTEVAGLTAKLVQVQELDDQLDWLKQTYALYGGYSDSKVNQVKGLSETDLAAINQQMSAYTQNPTQTFTQPPLPSLGYGTPSLAFNYGTSGEYGGTGGYPYDDVDLTSYFERWTRITKLQLRTGDRVDRLTVTYQSESGENVAVHGGGGGSDGVPLTVLPQQFVTRIRGRYNEKIDRLYIYITGGAVVTGGGNSGNTDFDFSVPSGSFGLGFRGRSNKELDRIQLVYASFKPAAWQPF